MRVSEKLVKDLKTGQPVFVMEQNKVATIINRFVEPNGSIVYRTDEGVSDAVRLIPIHTEKTLNNLIKIFGVAPSVDKKIKAWFKF